MQIQTFVQEHYRHAPLRAWLDKFFAITAHIGRQSLKCAWHELPLSVHASLTTEPAFAAVGSAVSERRIGQIDVQRFKRALMKK